MPRKYTATVFMNGGSHQATVQRLIQVIFGMNETAAGATKRKRRTDHQRKSDLLGKFFPFKERVGRTGRRYRHAQLNHPLAELFPVFRFIDGFNINPNYFYVVFIP